MISILCPTRKRPDGLQRVIDSAYRTANHKQEFVCYVDNDDSSYDHLIFPDELQPLIRFVRGPRIVLSNTWNKCAAAARGDIFMQGNDDIVFKTPGWDDLVEREFAKVPDRILMVHGSDASGGGSGSFGAFAVHPFVSRRWYEVLGYVTPPYFSSDYGDTWINHLANSVDRRRYLPFVIEHMHYWFGKMEMDENTRDRLDRHSKDNVEQIYRNLSVLRELDVRKLKEAICPRSGQS